jgi:hypothetical protein
VDLTLRKLWILKRGIASSQLRQVLLSKNPGPDGIWPDTPFQPNADDTWPPESDAPFIEYARQHVLPLLRSRMVIIEALASSLTMGSLDEEDIDGIRRDFSF